MLRIKIYLDIEIDYICWIYRQAILSLAVNVYFFFTAHFSRLGVLYYKEYIMRRFIFLSLMILLTFFAACKKEQQKQTEQITQGTTEKSTASTLPSFSNDYLVSVYEAQELIKMEGDNADLRKKYCSLAYHPDQQFFVSMGIARLHHPQTGQAIPQYQCEQAAKFDAIRWASYGEKWLKNNYEPPFGKLTVPATRPIEIINTAQVGDSLFLFVGTRFALQ